MHTSAWNSSNSKLAVACPITALCWAAMVLQTPEIEKSTHFCGCDFRQNELFIKRWILAQCKPINSKLSEHNVNPIVHQVATNYLELLVHLHSWVSNCQIPLPNSTAKFCNCLKNDNFTSLAEIYCWTWMGCRQSQPSSCNLFPQQPCHQPSPHQLLLNIHHLVQQVAGAAPPALLFGAGSIITSVWPLYTMSNPPKNIGRGPNAPLPFFWPYQDFESACFPNPSLSNFGHLGKPVCHGWKFCFFCSEPKIRSFFFGSQNA